VLERVTARRYVTPLHEGGSLPGLMEADDLGTYVVKFRGAGQGPKALVAEVVCHRLATALGLLVPDLVLVDLDAALAPGEPDEEVQDLLRASAGLNLGVDFLPGAFDLDRPAGRVAGEWAARRPYDVTHHALREVADPLDSVDAELAAAVTDTVLAEAVAAVPGEWLTGEPDDPDPAALRRSSDGRTRVRSPGAGRAGQTHS